MDIREFTTYSEKSPYAGYGIWIVLEEKGRRAHLLHPGYLCELIVSEYEFVSSSGATLWPNNATGSSFNAAEFMERFKKRISYFLENGRSFPIQTVAKALAGLEEISVEEALAFIGSLSVDECGVAISKTVSTKANREYAVREDVDLSQFRGRAHVLLDTLREHGPASIYQITSLVDGKLETTSDLKRVVTFFVNKLASQGILEIVA